NSVAEWFQRACARDANLRYQSADEMVEALDLALGVSQGAMNRGSSPDVKIDTLRGHAPPLAHGVPRSPSDSGEFARGTTQVLTTDPKLLNSDPALSVRALDAELSIPTSSRAPLFIAAGIGVLILFLIAGALLLGHSKSAPSTAEAATATATAMSTPTSSVMISAAKAAPIAPEPPPVAARAPPAVASAAIQPAVTAVVETPAPPRARPAVPAAHAQKPAQNPPPEPAQSPRNTSTDMGF
ncbi:MAG TPA: hypothetical protein VHW01_24965, partial [Polyangiaceae bacterium]|nr:hypothetical protein [Polyangiaceae bacterium]